MSSMENQQPPCRHSEFMAFLSDAESVTVVERYAVLKKITSSLIRQGDVEDAISALRQAEQPPLRLMIDISDSADPLGDLARLADACHTDISVVVVASRTDVGLFRDLLRMGVDDYLSKPLTVDLLRHTAVHPHRKATPC
jgi:pilus assembly protein CpaE